MGFSLPKLQWAKLINILGNYINLINVIQHNNLYINRMEWMNEWMTK